MPDIKITPQGEIVGGGAMSSNEVLYTLCKAVFGADANGVVSVQKDVTAGRTGLAAPSILQAARDLEVAIAPVTPPIA